MYTYTEVLDINNIIDDYKYGMETYELNQKKKYKKIFNNVMEEYLDKLDDYHCSKYYRYKSTFCYYLLSYKKLNSLLSI